VLFNAGDNIQSHEGWSLDIVSREEVDGIITYYGRDEQNSQRSLNESELDNFLQLNKPTDRLFSGQFDHNKWFTLRYMALRSVNQIAQSDTYGLSGARADLIPHQLYIAHEVASRFAPRVLLADEVGLGKTIEAGLIIQQQILTERAKRVLIVVPRSLVHQWLVEMRRRFNLKFSVYNESRCQDEEQGNPGENPFHGQQLILCSLDFLTQNPQRYVQALSGEWDLTVIDEAHHLEWTPDSSSIEYDVVETLADRTKGVLLLTATPEQFGKSSHFARLRLLDPERFSSFEKFEQEEKGFEPIATALEILINQEVAAYHDLAQQLSSLTDHNTDELLTQVINTMAQDTDQTSLEHAQARIKLIDNLLDRHGTGRILFRNTRAAVKGFPERQLISYQLPFPTVYIELLNLMQADESLEAMLYPEITYRESDYNAQQHWTEIDNRVIWLLETVQILKPHKVLLIAANATTAIDLAQTLRKKTGIRSAVFHEGLSMIERDRAAAYFADDENGCQVLICSEIGSEGRNFQFAHHLILFDLPLNPDLLEQRIGRLDRIGQKNVIQIHVPYLEKSPQASLYHWYQRGLAAFEHTCPAGHTVFTQVFEELSSVLLQPTASDDKLEQLIDKTRDLHQQLNDRLHKGRDKLLEYNSCRLDVAKQIKTSIEDSEKHSNIAEFMEQIFDCYGIDLEDHKYRSFIIKPSDHMHTAYFPGLTDDGMTITYHRDIALSNENIEFISWEHPLTINALDFVLGSEMGNSTVTAIKSTAITGRPFPAGSLLLEVIFILEPSSVEDVLSRHNLPPTIIRVVVDKSGQAQTDKLAHGLDPEKLMLIDNETANKIVRSHAQEIRDMVVACDRIALEQTPEVLEQAHKPALLSLQNEITRLQELQELNSNIRQEEIDFFATQQDNVLAALANAAPRLDAVRIIVTT
ncbi:MAG: RNA polymerase-associated protein RapA, partial [Thiohalomonadales bacterium]